MKKIAILLIAVLLTFTGTVLAQEQVLRLGVLVDRTGSRAFPDELIETAIEIAAEEINTYLSEINAPLRVELVTKDTHSDPDKALTELTLLSREGVRVVVGPTTSAELQRLERYAVNNGLILISPSSTAPSLAKENDTIFRFTVDDRRQAEALAQIMIHDQIKAVVVIRRDDLYASDLAEYTRQNFFQMGGERYYQTAIWEEYDWDSDTGGICHALIPFQERAAFSFPPDPSSPFFERYIEDLEADCIPGVIYNPNSVSFVSEVEDLSLAVSKAVRKYGAGNVAVQVIGFDEVATIFQRAAEHPVLSRVRWYGSDATALSEVFTRNPRVAQFAVDTRFTATMIGQDEQAADALRQLEAKMISRIGRGPDMHAASAYDAVWVVAKAYLATGMTDSATILSRAITETAKWHFGASGFARLNAAGDRNMGSYDYWTVMQNRNAYEWQVRGSYIIRPGIGAELIAK